jgi:hypothetical protein
MKKIIPRIWIFPVILLVIIFIGLRLSTAIPAITFVKNDLLDMLIYKRNYSYDQKMDMMRKDDYRFSKLVKEIVNEGETLNFRPNEFNHAYDPNIIANFIYPIQLTSSKSGENSFEAIYPDYHFVNEDECTKVYIFDIENLRYSTIECKALFAQKKNYKNIYGLIEK